ncbi:MAG TPA: hypothetical protein VMS99_16460 [Acidimicrobiia bacterium]|nr:hypothetical protein [Acidimicrobiia bacterium]
MRSTIRFVSTVVLILIAVPVFAKGPMSATISGPGIDEPIELFDQRQSEQVMHEHIVDLIEQTGLWYANQSLERVDPPVEPGQPLMLAWWGGGEHTIQQVIYLHADGGPVIHTPEGQTALEGWGGEVTGWFRAPVELGDTLQALGVPVDAPTGSPSVLGWVAALALVGFLATRLVNSRLRPVVSSQ